MRHKSVTRGLIFTSTFWLLNYCHAWLSLMSYGYVLVGFGAAALVSHHDYDNAIPDWFTFLIAPCVGAGVWLLFNFPLVVLLAVLVMYVYSAGGFRKATHGLLDFLLHLVKTDSTEAARPGTGIAMIMNSEASSQADMARTLGPSSVSSSRRSRHSASPRSHSLSHGHTKSDIRGHTNSDIRSRSFKVDSISRLVDTRPPPAPTDLEHASSKSAEQQGIAAPLVTAPHHEPAPAPAPPAPEAGPTLVPSPSFKRLERVKFMDQEDCSSSAASEDSSEAESPAATSRPASRFPSLPSILRHTDDSDSASDSDHGGRTLLQKRGRPSLQITHKVPLRIARSRFAAREAAAEAHHQDDDAHTPAVKRSQTLPVDHQNGAGLSTRSTPKQASYPELPDTFRDKFMQKSVAVSSSEARDKFMRSETVQPASVRNR